MACGTGKTLTALWIAERMQAQRTLILVPTLSLMAQFVREWLKHSSEPFVYLPVCSDETVTRGNDAPIMYTSQLEFPVTTEPGEIASFLQEDGRQVVFCTYHSSKQVVAAQADGTVPEFDLVLADEAHHCAGKADSDFRLMLDNSKVRAQRRLFMTATPRIYRGKKKDSMASMDDESKFGFVFHRLSFGDAINRKLLTDYQVVEIGRASCRERV